MLHTSNEFFKMVQTRFGLCAVYNHLFSSFPEPVTTPEVTTEEPTTQAATTTSAVDDVEYEVEFEISNMNFTVDLNDTKSALYSSVADQMHEMVSLTCLNIPFVE
jgi:hypothetical protein